MPPKVSCTSRVSSGNRLLLENATQPAPMESSYLYGVGGIGSEMIYLQAQCHRACGEGIPLLRSTGAMGRAFAVVQVAFKAF
jgi:hypothetical protein